MSVQHTGEPFDEPTTGHSPQPEFYKYPGKAEQPLRRGSCGCWLVGALTAFVVAVLVVVGLFLPPISLGDRLFGPDYAYLDSVNNAAQTDDTAFKVIVDPGDAGDDFGVALDTVAADRAISDDNIYKLPGYLALMTDIYEVEATGTVPQVVNLTVNLPRDVNNTDLIDMYGWYEEGGWRYLPSRLVDDGSGTRYQFSQVTDVPQRVGLFQAQPVDPVIASTLSMGETVSSETGRLLNILQPIGMQPALPTTPQRTLVGNPVAGFEVGANYRVLPVIRNYTDPRATDPATVVELLNSAELTTEHIEQLTTFASAGGYQGVFIDYRDLPADQREVFSRFIEQLASRLDRLNLRLGVIVPAAQNIEGVWETGAYDWRSLGQVADYLQIDLSRDPTTFSPGPDRMVEAMLRWAVGEVSRYKLLGGLTARSIQERGGSFTSVGYTEALSPLGNVDLDVALSQGGTVEPGSPIRIELDGLDALPGVDTTIQSPFINYLSDDGSLISTMWLTTGEALRFRMERFSPFHLGGVAFDDLLASGIADGVYEEIVSYKVQIPGSSQPAEELVLNWRIESADGRIAEFTTGFNEDIVVTVDAPDGNYAVNVDVVGGGISSTRGGAPVAVFAPTATPTPLPTATPLPTPTPTPTLAPIVPTQAPAVAQNNDGNTEQQAAPPPSSGLPVPGAAVNPGPGSIAGGAFEYGGHVTNTGSARAIGAMQQAGMRWMKVQIRYGVGMDTGSASQAIQQAHGAGFKILLGIVGFPDQLAAGGGDYIRQFAGYTGAVAALGPDAIEVWNEPNLDREWPEGQISGGNYTALLRESYNAIKAANGGVMVISGAPAPTGAELAYPGKVVNDDNFLRQMVNSGALQFMDCVGMHYNEGLVSPRATSGDPRDNYYTRYLPLMIETYWGITGGQRPICITELGYLTPEGYPPLTPFFGWAQNMTIAQHAAWLADAAAYSSQTGRVRLMIVWNVDFTRYDADPMAGYAIIRANGDCPACRAMAGAR